MNRPIYSRYPQDSNADPIPGMNETVTIVHLDIRDNLFDNLKDYGSIVHHHGKGKIVMGRNCIYKGGGYTIRNAEGNTLEYIPEYYDNSIIWATNRNNAAETVGLPDYDISNNGNYFYYSPNLEEVNTTRVEEEYGIGNLGPVLLHDRDCAIRRIDDAWNLGIRCVDYFGTKDNSNVFDDTCAIPWGKGAKDL